MAETAETPKHSKPAGAVTTAEACLAHPCRSEKPKDVIQYLEEEGVVKLGEFLVTVSTAVGGC